VAQLEASLVMLSWVPIKPKGLGRLLWQILPTLGVSRQALDSNTRAFSLADHARGTAQQKRLLQGRLTMSGAQERMRAATKL